jgi:carbamate kinase
MAIMVIRKYAGALPICDAKSAYHGIESQIDRPIQASETSNAIKNLNLIDMYMPLASLGLRGYH